MTPVEVIILLGLAGAAAAAALGGGEPVRVRADDDRRR